MRQGKSKRIKKTFAWILSICMMLTSVVVMPTSIYAAEETPKELTSLKVMGTEVDISETPTGTVSGTNWSYDQASKKLKITGDLTNSTNSNLNAVIEATGDLNVEINGNVKLDNSSAGFGTSAVIVDGKLTITGDAGDDTDSLTVSGRNGVSCDALNVDLSGKFNASAEYYTIHSGNSVEIKTTGDISISTKGGVYSDNTISSGNVKIESTDGAVNIAAEKKCINTSLGIDIKSKGDLNLIGAYDLNNECSISLVSSEGNVAVKNAYGDSLGITCKDAATISAGGTIQFAWLQGDEEMFNAILKGTISTPAIVNLYNIGIDNSASTDLTNNVEIQVDEGATYPATINGTGKITVREPEPQAVMYMDGNDREGTPLIPGKYYLNDGSEGSADNYNIYCGKDDGLITVKNAKIYGLQMQNANGISFVGETTIGGIRSRTAIELIGNNAIVHINKFGIAAEKSRLYIRGLNMDVKINGDDAMVEGALEASAIEIVDSNVSIEAKNGETSYLDGIYVNSGEIVMEDSNVNIDSEKDGILCDEGATLDIYRGTLNIEADNIGIMKGAMRISDGTVTVNGTAMGIDVDSLVFSGGSLNANSTCQYDEEEGYDYFDKLLIPTFDDAEDSPVYKTVVTLENATDKKKLTSLTTSLGDEYGSDSIYTDASGKIYLYLPEGATVTKATIGDTEYTGTITATTEGVTGILKEIIKQPTVVNPPTTSTPPTSTTPTAVLINKISISGISKQIAVGKSIMLSANILPANATNKAVTWKSSNTNYASVDSKGKVTTKKAGKGKYVTITATAKDGSNKTATYRFKIMKGTVKKVKVTGAKSLKVGKTLKLKAKVTASKGANKKLQWTSSNKKYATVSSSGKVKALKAGKGKTVKITAKATDGSKKSKTVKIKIK